LLAALGLAPAPDYLVLENLFLIFFEEKERERPKETVSGLTEIVEERTKQKKTPRNRRKVTPLKPKVRSKKKEEEPDLELDLRALEEPEELEEVEEEGREKEDVSDDELEGRTYDPLKRYLSDISKHRVLSREEEREIAERAYEFKDGNARQQLITANLRLVIKIALEYYKPQPHVNLLDMIQSGNEGLVHASDKYSPYRGTRFSTYSSFWIRAYILKYIMDSWSVVKVGTTQAQRKLFYRLKREKSKLEGMGITPTREILAEIIKVKPKEVETMEIRLAYSDSSLDQPVYAEGEETFLDEMGSGEDVEEEVAEKECRERINKKVELFRRTLNEKELVIFDCRLFIDDNPATLSKIGERFGISRERVRQLGNRILRKLENFNKDLETKES
jgi:RNA polymerase sigma-32 factor